MADESGETRRQRNARFGIAESPELEAPDAAAHVWGWFWELSGRSHSGPEALTFADIGQWASLLQLELLTDSSPIQPPPPLPDLPPTREQQQQAPRLAAAGAEEIERIKEALEPHKPPAETKPRAKDPMKMWMRVGLQLGRR